jgi:hypothetical protein
MLRVSFPKRKKGKEGRERGEKRIYQVTLTPMPVS